MRFKGMYCRTAVQKPLLIIWMLKNKNYLCPPPPEQTEEEVTSISIIMQIIPHKPKILGLY